MILERIAPGLSFAHPWALLGLVAAAGAGWLLRRRRGHLPTLVVPSVAPARVPPSRWARLWWAPATLVAAAIALTSIGLAGPRLRAARRLDLSVQGIDIVVAFDLSTSMLAADFRPRRIGQRIGIGCDHDPVGFDRACRGAHDPFALRSFCASGRASRKDFRTGGECGAGKAPDIGERLQGPGTRIKQRTRIRGASHA